MDTKKELTVNAIKEGTVIDHIPSKNLFKVLSILNIDEVDTTITIGNNLESGKLGRKGIIKIAGVFPSLDDINKIALIAPTAKINIIEDYKVVEKKEVEIPEEIHGIIKCMNPKCITNFERNLSTRFTVVKQEDEIELKCHYCEKNTTEDNFKTLS